MVETNQQPKDMVAETKTNMSTPDINKEQLKTSGDTDNLGKRKLAEMKKGEGSLKEKEELAESSSSSDNNKKEELAQSEAVLQEKKLEEKDELKGAIEPEAKKFKVGEKELSKEELTEEAKEELSKDVKEKVQETEKKTGGTLPETLPGNKGEQKSIKKDTIPKTQSADTQSKWFHCINSSHFHLTNLQTGKVKNLINVLYCWDKFLSISAFIRCNVSISSSDNRE